MKKRSPKSKVQDPKSATGRDRRQIGMLPEVHLQLAPAAARWIAETLYDQLDEIHDPLPETTKAQVREAIKFLYVHQRRCMACGLREGYRQGRLQIKGQA